MSSPAPDTVDGGRPAFPADELPGRPDVGRGTIGAGRTVPGPGRARTRRVLRRSDGEGGRVADRSCVKRRYRDEATAELALARIREAGDAREKTPQRTYRCPRCRGWHLTSWPE